MNEYEQTNGPIEFSQIYVYDPVAIYTCNQDGYITFFNKTAAALWGKEPEIGKDLYGCWKIYHPDGSPMPLNECPMARTLKEGIPYDNELITVEMPDHSFKHFRVFSTPLFDAQNKLTGSHNTLIDSTDRQQAETGHAMLAAIVASSDDAIISKDLNGIITSWNEGAERIFGYNEAEIIGRSITVLIPPSRIDEEQRIIGSIKKGNRIDHFETIRIDKYGKEIPISLTVSPIKDNKGNVIGASKVARDITEQLASKAMVEKLFQEVKALSEKKDEFIALASHELKTPLTSIKGYLQILGRNELEQMNRRFLDKSLNQVDKLHVLVEDMLSMSKIEAGKLEFSKDTFDIRALLLDIIETVNYSNTTHTIIHELNHGDPVIIEADNHRIEQAIFNLMNNAIKYSPGADKVEVTLSLDHENVIIGIRDEGMGLTATQQKEIFSRFYRVEGTKGIGGLGLGLYLTKQIIDRHHGSIQVQSELGKGSVFSVILPRKEEQA